MFDSGLGLALRHCPGVDISRSAPRNCGGSIELSTGGAGPASDGRNVTGNDRPGLAGEDTCGAGNETLGSPGGGFHRCATGALFLTVDQGPAIPSWV